MITIRRINTGLIYRNPKPHVHSVHAYFPSVVCMANGELLASIVLGETFEAVNLQTHFCRSTDGGETWTLEKAIDCSVPDRLTFKAPPPYATSAWNARNDVTARRGKSWPAQSFPGRCNRPPGGRTLF